jgi:hypothetical protein
MTADTYVALKAKGKVTLAKNFSAGAGLIKATYSVFDSVGNETIVVDNFTVADVVAQRTALQTQVANMQTFITDLQAAP